MRSCRTNSAHSRPLKWQTCRQLFRATRMCSSFNCCSVTVVGASTIRSMALAVSGRSDYDLHLHAGGKAVEIVSNVLTLKIRPAPALWLTEQIAAAKKILDMPAAPNDQSAKERLRAIRMLRFLDSPEAAQELVRRLPAAQDVDFVFGPHGGARIAIPQTAAAANGAALGRCRSTGVGTLFGPARGSSGTGELRWDDAAVPQRRVGAEGVAGRIETAGGRSGAETQAVRRKANRFPAGEAVGSQGGVAQHAAESCNSGSPWRGRSILVGVIAPYR